MTEEVPGQLTLWDRFEPGARHEAGEQVTGQAPLPSHRGEEPEEPFPA